MTDEPGLSLADRIALADLVAAYAAAVDTRDWDGVAALFLPDGELISPDPPRSLMPVTSARGSAAIVAAMQQLSYFACTFHHVTGSVFRASGPTSATGRTTAVAHHVEARHVEAGPARSWAWHVIYTDEFTKSGDRWRFARRALTVAMIESRPLAAVLSP